MCKVHAVQRLEVGITYYWGFDIVDPIKKKIQIKHDLPNLKLESEVNT